MQQTVVPGIAMWSVWQRDRFNSNSFFVETPDGNLAVDPLAPGDAGVDVIALRKVCPLRPQHLLPGDGACIFGDAYRTLWEALEAPTDVYVNRINARDAESKSWDEPASFGSETFDPDVLIGAEELRRLSRIARGQAFRPLHRHLAEEPFYVLGGSVTPLAPRGERDRVRGDFVSFPTRANGAHRIVIRTLDSHDGE